MRAIIRLGAVAIIVASFFFARATAHDRVMVLVVEGARMAEVRALAQAGHLPALESWLAGGVGGEIVSAPETASSDALLKSLMEVGNSDRDLGASPLWTELERRGRPYVLAAITDTDFVDEERRVVLAGPDAATGFIGSNTGLVLNRRTVTRGDLPWPYGVVKEEVTEAVRSLGQGEESGWIPWMSSAGADSRNGVFTVTSLDRDTVYLSPVYTRYRRLPAGSDSLYVADNPSRVRVFSRTSEYLPAHVSRLSAARAEAARSVAASHEWDLFVYVDRRLAVFDRDRDLSLDDMPEELRLAYVELDRALADLAAVAGDRTAVLVVGLAGPVAEHGRALGWLAVPGVVGDLSSWGPISGGEVAATLAYLLGFGSSMDRRPVAGIATRFPVRGRARFLVGGVAGASAKMPANATALRDIAPKQPSESRSPS